MPTPVSSKKLWDMISLSKGGWGDFLGKDGSLATTLFFCRCQLVSIRKPRLFPSPLMGEGVKKLEFAPSPCPLPAGERVNLLK